MLEGMPLESLDTGGRYHIIIIIMVSGGARESLCWPLAVGGCTRLLALSRDEVILGRLTILDRFWGNGRFWGGENY